MSRRISVAIEFLSPGTESTDLGRFFTADDAIDEESEIEIAKARGSDAAPDKLTVYERLLRIPHYIVCCRRKQRLRYFQLSAGRYQEQALRVERLVERLRQMGIDPDEV